MFNEKFQCKDTSDNNAAMLTQQYLELLTQAHDTTSFVAPDLPACLGSVNANTAGRLPTTRRHSSMLAPTSPAKPTTLVPLSEVNGFFNNGFGGALETVNEERFRNRAYSEGSYLNSDALLEQQQQQAQSGTSRYKTELCRPFEENGKCKYGEKCQFAHGKHELRHMVRHPKYKTELCRTYHTTGLCPYGPRCHFIHNQDEPVIPMITNPVHRHNRGNPPSNLQLFPQQRATTRLNSHSYSPPLETTPFFGMNDNSVISPISPIGHGIGKTFQYSNHMVSPTELPRINKFRCLSENRQPSPPLTPYDFAQGQFSDLSVHDDVVFDGPPTPPDSDRESATGSPPGFAAPAPSSQRLPIFKCLSQSD